MGKVRNFIVEQGITLAIQQTQQMLVLDKEFEALETKVNVLQSENLKLRGEVEPLKRIVERLEEQAKAHAGKPGTPTMELDTTKEDMLRVFNLHPDSLTEDMGKTFDMTSEAAKYHLDLMRKSKLVDNEWDALGEHWHLIHEGRAYLHKKGWLK